MENRAAPVEIFHHQILILLLEVLLFLALSNHSLQSALRVCEILYWVSKRRVREMKTLSLLSQIALIRSLIMKQHVWILMQIYANVLKQRNPRPYILKWNTPSSPSVWYRYRLRHTHTPKWFVGIYVARCWQARRQQWGPGLGGSRPV